jgi:hypothetical protein
MIAVVARLSARVPIRSLSGWLAVAVAFGCCWFAAYGIAAVTLAVLGWFRPVPVVVAAALLVVPIGALARPARAATAVAAATWAPVAVLVCVAGFGAVQYGYAGEHVLADRDPGVYVVTARHAAKTGELVVDARETPFLVDPDVTFASPGFEEDGRRGLLYPQFAHLLPVLMAPAAWVGGDELLFKVPGLLGVFGLLVFHAFASRVLRPWFAAMATIALAVNPLYVHFSRDAYSEIPALIAMFAGLVFLWDARPALDVRGAGAAGLLLGIATMARIDGFVGVVPLLAYVFYEAWRNRTQSRDEDRPTVLPFLGALVAGMATSTAIGLVDVRLRAPFYFADQRRNVISIAVGALVVAVLGTFAVVIAPRWRKSREVAGRERAVLADAAAALVVLAGLLLWFVRPLFQEFRVAGRPSYLERIFERIGWYIGPITLMAGILGLAVIVRALVQGRCTRSLPFVLLFATTTVLYVWRPQIRPDHLWVMRRFLPLTVPGFVLAASVLVEVLARSRRGHSETRRRLHLGVASALAVVMIGAPLLALRPIFTERHHVGMLGLTRRVCDEVGPHAAVAVLPNRRVIRGHADVHDDSAARPSILVGERSFGPTARTFCRVPVAFLPADATTDMVAALARRWAPRALFVVSGLPEPLDVLMPLVRAVSVAVETQEVEQTLGRRPDRRERYVYALYIARVPPP